MIRIAVGGAEGRMGRLISDLVEACPKTELTLRITRPTAVSDGWEAMKTPVDVFIDFSHRDAVIEHLEKCALHGISMVIGVTGLAPEQKEQILFASKTLPIILAPNMSIGANLSFKLLEMVTKILKEKEQLTDIAVTEVHHRHKKDSPSGTAKRMAEIIADGLGKTLEESKIQFSSLRLGDVMGDHSAVFALEGEQLEITHKACNRIIFAQGAMLAAKWLYGKPPGLYDMQDVLGL